MTMTEARSTAIDQRMNQFLLASRSLFNGFFAVEKPWDDPHHAWDLADLFRPIERELFKSLVQIPLGISGPDYGDGPQLLRVQKSSGTRLTAMINRETDISYWDYPVHEIPEGSDVRFISFFDWSGVDRRDNRYVMAVFLGCPANNDLIGKRALIESHRVVYDQVSGSIEA